MNKDFLEHLHDQIQGDHSGDGVDRRGFLECMAWVGTGVLWTVSGGLLSSRRLAFAAGEQPPRGEFSFVQISDSHIGFAADANRDVTATLQVALDKVKALQPSPAFLLHTGDLTHGQKPEQFDTLAGKIQGAGVGEVFYVPASTTSSPMRGRNTWPATARGPWATAGGASITKESILSASTMS
jgi:Icc protein